jgi:hypothetical protein
MIAFLYDVAGSPPMLETLLAEIARIDPDLAFRSRIYSGSLLLRTMARYVVSASRDDKDQEKRMEHVDRGTVRTIAGDLVECFAAQRHTVDLLDLVIRLMRDKVECVALGTCPINLANELDRALHAQSWYLGYVEPDLGNPIQYELFIDLLTKHVQLAGPELLESWPEPITFPQDYRPYHHSAIQEWDFENVADPVPPREATTPNGVRSEQRVKSAFDRRPHKFNERIAKAALRTTGSFRLNDPANQVLVRRRSPLGIVKLEVDPADLKQRLVSYALNREHVDGGSKAHVFASALSITDEQWLFLASQISANVANAEISRIIQDEHGLRIGTRLNVRGLDGKSATIELGWIEQNGTIRLITARVAKKNRQRPGIPNSTRVDGLSGKAFYEEVYRRAHAAGHAAQDAIMPKPMVVTSTFGNSEEINDVIYEFGSAYVAVEDARTGFARWLVRSGHGRRAIRGGAIAPAPNIGGSFDKAQAYAEAFAAVLRENDIVCDIVTVDD